MKLNIFNIFYIFLLKDASRQGTFRSVIDKFVAKTAFVSIILCLLIIYQVRPCITV